VTGKSKQRRNAMTKTLIILSVIACVLAAPAAADNIAPAKRADIEKLMRITGPPDVTKQMSNFFILQLSQAIKASRPDLPARTYQILSEEINRIVEEYMTAKGGYLDMVVPIYDRHLSHEDIKGFLKFYQTELGKKMIKTYPLIFQESMALLQDWSKSIGPLIKNKINQRFQKEGIDLSV
jgi:hypothetical protein